MKTYLECIPCFLNQALKAMDLTNEDYKVKEKVMKEIMNELTKINLDKKPPEFAKFVYDKIYRLTGNNDPYKEIKDRDNKKAMKKFSVFKQLVEKSRYPLLVATKIAIAGNIMDFAANSHYDIEKSIESSLKNDFAIDDYNKFKADLVKAKSIIYLADNSGEIVLDKLLLETIRKINNCKIHLFVKGKPIVNDATEADLKFINISQIPNLQVCQISTGFPNTGFLKVLESKIPDRLKSLISKESREFSDILKDSLLIISKGQGNYESLSEIDANIYFLLIAKCPVIARDLGVKKGDFVCKNNIGG